MSRRKTKPRPAGGRVFMPTRRELEKLRARHKGLHERYGRYCVFLDGRRVQCFRTEESAERVARGFGPGFRRKRETSDG